MALNHRFGANCDQRFYQTTGRASRRPLQAGGALAPAFVLTGLVIATHDLHLMDQFGFARRLVVGDGKLTIFDGLPS